MNGTLLLVVVIIAVALIFDFINGFHDAANSIATVVSTRVLTPLQAVIWAAFFNFVAAFSFGTGVARMVGAGMVNLHYVTPYVILAGVVGAITWDLITWWFGLPTSSSHALMIAVYWLFRNFTPRRMDIWFRRLQLVSAGMLSWSHGTNDAQKTMGIITGVLVTAGYLKKFEVPIFVILSAHAAIALGTLSGGWRIVHTMGRRLTRLKPRSGFCAESAAAISILFATWLHLPVSTTHVTAGAIAGVGSIQRVKAVRWGVAQRILWAWILTIPASAIVGWVSLMVFHIFRPDL